ncbi:MAG: ribosomal L7Ae/L30e/S12e/Gadd45 family protein [Gemmatimonadota bacterium]|nr:ribosomal L7Ae/L30e/S12e/Gadd45 family protein [Gemmatimonadota bacterium]MDH3366309.1 ribosomal L7Ae/L30e/S12e/Gadd45 family protein [Gemmatimonadota bacterium]MDH3477049.1 ribosomal L7Ae/L30e/S12e/Gadd45 family protein [Gemmatimonadota bacterium]MDH3569377.1 ribosomal L7Ae/L30e/S12e/Gadd45 family protein [Gemmatimonadota bacterium]MDH5549533.1 ribosomal L7Ae/L30e/S12e/Gadd45 family protein [Gemmatimonadota bacterium]
MSARQLGMLGLGLRAGSVIVGTGGVRAALQRGEVKLLILAADVSSRTEQKVVRLAESTGIPMLSGPEARELGRRLGRDAVQAVGVRDARLAAGIVGDESSTEARRT